MSCASDGSIARLLAQAPLDLVILEVGLGGRLDSTNVIERPLAGVITPIGMDHVEFLGNTLASIAGEKAGIIKRGVPVICAEQADEAMGVIEAQAARLRAPLFAANQQWHVGVERGRLVYQDDRGLMDLAAPKLFGRHQFAVYPSKLRLALELGSISLLVQPPDLAGKIKKCAGKCFCGVLKPVNVLVVAWLLCVPCDNAFDCLKWP